MLKINHLTFFYADKEFQLHVNIPKQARVAIEGPSGIGKTTFLNLISGFLKPSEGEIMWEDQYLQHLSIEERPIAYLFQSHHVFNHLSVQDNLRLGLYSLPPGIRQHQRSLILSIAQALKLEEHLRKRAAFLSGGQKQRVALGRLILQGQPLWLLDEPFNGLDFTTKNDIYQLLIEWQHQTQATILFTTHHEQEIMAFATHRMTLQVLGKTIHNSSLTPIAEGIVFKD